MCPACGTGLPALQHTARPTRSLTVPWPWPLCSKYWGATSSKVVTPLTAIRDALPDANVVYNASTARFFTTENAQADAEACEVRRGWGACKALRQRSRRGAGAG